MSSLKSELITLTLILDAVRCCPCHKTAATLTKAAKQQFAFDLNDAARLKGVDPSINPYETATPTIHEINIADGGKKLDAVKRYRDRTGHTLMESKRTIEAYMKNPHPSYSRFPLLDNEGNPTPL